MASLHSSNEDGPFTLITTPRFETGKVSSSTIFVLIILTEILQDDQYTVCATEMALVHNTFIRAFNSIYHAALEVQPKDYKPFLSYAQACYLGLEAHHTGEETSGFPAIEQVTGVKGLMDVNVAQHEAFHGPLHTYAEYITSFLNNTVPISQFSGAHLRTLIEAFAEPLNQHLHDEIPTILGLAKYGDALDLAGIFAKEGEEVMAKLPKTTVMAAFMLNNDVTFEGGIHVFPPIPGPVRFLLLRVFTLWHWSWWSWTSCDKSGKLRVAKGGKA
jgi:hypothetical protein